MAVPRPAVGSFAERIYDALGPLTFADEDNGWPMLRFMEANGQMFQEIYDLVSDRPGIPGWSQIVDPYRAPFEFLAWMAQMRGGDMPIGKNLSEAEIRRLIAQSGGWQRGSAASLVNRIQQALIGTKTVWLFEQDTSPYHFTVATRVSETPDQVYVDSIIRSEKPAGLQYTYTIVVGVIFNEVTIAYATFQDVKNAFATFQGLRNNIPGT